MRHFAITLFFFQFLILDCFAQDIKWKQTFPYKSALIAIAIAPSGDIIMVRAHPGSFNSPSGYGFKSTDSGESWNVVPLVPKINYPTSVLVLKSGIILVGTEGDHIYRSSDGGSSWEQKKLGTSRVLSLAAKGDSLVFAGTYPGDVSNVFCSTDDGLSWKWAGGNLTWQWVSALALGPNGDLYSGCTNGLFRSSDDGITWEGPFLKGYDVTAIAVSFSGRIFAGTLSGKILSSANQGLSWDSSGVGLSTDWIHNLLITENGDIFAATGAIRNTFVGGLFRSTNNGSSWSRAGLDSVVSISLSVTKDNRLIVGTTEGVYIGILENSANITSIKESTPPENSFSIEPNFPNPFNSQTRIKFNIQKASQTVVELFDLQGKHIAKLFDQYCYPGPYEFGIDAKNLPSGAYVYRLKTQYGQQSRKFILAK